MTVYKDTLDPVSTVDVSEVSRIVAIVIGINAIVITLGAFRQIEILIGFWLSWIDILCEVFFLIEITVRIRKFGFKTFFGNNWNKFDFIVVVASSPVLLTPFYPMAKFNVLLMLRLARLIRIFKLLYFIPHRERLITGIGRALNASVGVFLGLLFILSIIAVGGTYLFGNVSEEMFGDPIRSAYTIFTIFTMDGWPDVADALIKTNDPVQWGLLVKAYMIFAVIVGGIFGLSILNAVFVDQLISDQTEGLESRLSRMELLLQELRDKETHSQSYGPVLDTVHSKIEQEDIQALKKDLPPSDPEPEWE